MDSTLIKITTNVIEIIIRATDYTENRCRKIYFG